VECGLFSASIGDDFHFIWVQLASCCLSTGEWAGSILLPSPPTVGLGERRNFPQWGLVGPPAEIEFVKCEYQRSYLMAPVSLNYLPLSSADCTVVLTIRPGHETGHANNARTI